MTDFTLNKTGHTEPLAAVPDSKPQVATNRQVKTYDDVVRRYDQLITDLKKQGLDEDEIRQQAAALFAELKAQLPARLVAVGKQSAHAKLHNEQFEEHYSVVLKTNGSKERLTKRLSEVLRRSLVATRMAIDMVPCIILYKSKADDIQKAVTIFKDENLHYTVIKGDFEIDNSVEKMLPGFADLQSEMQLMLRNVPGKLWLGEKIQVTVPEVDLEGEAGALVATDQALYIFSKLDCGRQLEWQIIPYYRLAEVILHNDQEAALELIYKGYGREEWLRIANDEQLEQVYEHVRLALLKQIQTPVEAAGIS